jgi:hypothetical protein
MSGLRRRSSRVSGLVEERFSWALPLRVRARLRQSGSVRFLRYPALTPQRAKRASATYQATIKATIFRRCRDWDIEGHSTFEDTSDCWLSSQRFSVPPCLRGEKLSCCERRTVKAGTLAEHRAPSLRSGCERRSHRRGRRCHMCIGGSGNPRSNRVPSPASRDRDVRRGFA